MYYSIICDDVVDSLEKRKSVRTAHLERLDNLANQNRLLLAGPHPAIDSLEPDNMGFTGSLIVAEFDSLEQAKAWADADPYVSAGVYARVSVKPFKKVF
jgi:hypothetical protein